MRQSRVFAGRVARMHDECLPNIAMLGVMAGGETKPDPPAKPLQHRVPEYRATFAIDITPWMQMAQGASR